MNNNLLYQINIKHHQQFISGTQNRGGVHIEEHNMGFSKNQYEANITLPLATILSPHLIIVEHLRVCLTIRKNKVAVFKLPMQAFWVLSNLAVEILTLRKIHNNVNFKTHHLLLGD